MLITGLLVILCLYSSYTDIRYRIIPNRLTHPLLFILLSWRLYQMESSFLWGLLPALLLFLLFWISPASVGPGDIKLFAIIGLSIGIDLTITTVLMMGLACMGYLSYLLMIRIWKKKVGGAIPLAPFMTVGLIAALVATPFLNV